jgi:hypothetical protein
MALSQSERNQIASYRVQIERFRQDLQSLKDNKKRTSESYSNMIKSTNDPNSKRSHRQSKINAINHLMNSIESKKNEIRRVQEYIKNIRS